jgi:hypothetical protein
MPGRSLRRTFRSAVLDDVEREERKERKKKAKGKIIRDYRFRRGWESGLEERRP